MRIAEFIDKNMELILQEWEGFARTIEPPALTMDTAALRDDAGLMLQTVAADLSRYQSDYEQAEKSKGRHTISVFETAAEMHGSARLLSGFSMVQLVSEYRALRASVLRLWTRGIETITTDQAIDLTRFNEAIDQLLAESVGRYTKMVDQSQNMFLAILGHDLRSPLNVAINGANYLMIARGMAPEHSAIANRMYSSGKRMSRLVEDLIDFSRTHLGRRLPVTPHLMNLGQVAKSVVEELRVAYPDRTIEYELWGSMECFWDENRIVQVLCNLIGNALQHGDPHMPVGAQFISSDEHMVITVSNKGETIPLSRMQSIFEPMVRFAHVDHPEPTAGENLGLGLYIAKEIILAHQGSIGVRSTATDGTHFTATIPRRPVCTVEHAASLLR